MKNFYFCLLSLVGVQFFSLVGASSSTSSTLSVEDKQGSLKEEFIRAISEKNSTRFHEILSQISTLDYLNEEGDLSPLVASLAHDFDEGTHLLLEKGASVVLANKRGITPLHCAAKSENPHWVTTLVRKGAKAAVYDKDGLTPLHHAMEVKKNSHIKTLIDAGCDRESCDQQGRTPFLTAAANNNTELLVEAYKKKATTEGASNEELAESIAIASLLTTNNVIYRFRHFVKKDEYQNQNAPARLRMNIMMNPVLGKEFFELISLAVSAVNGCEQCVVAHENSVLEAGATEKRIWDAIRIAAVITSLGKVIR